MRAARWMKVSPWDLAEQPSYWRERALMAESVEGEVLAEKQRRARRGKAPGH